MKLVNLELDINDAHALINVLRFYADPTTYINIAMIPGEYPGSILDDRHDTRLGNKPGKKASAMIYYLYSLAAGEVPKTDIPLIENFLIDKEQEMAIGSQQPTTAVKQEAEIPEQFCILLSTIETLENVAEAVEISILKILSDTQNTREDDESEPTCSSAVARETQDLRQRIVAVNRRLSELNGRIEL